MTINQSNKSNNKSTEDKQSIKNNVRAQELGRGEAKGGHIIWEKLWV